MRYNPKARLSQDQVEFHRGRRDSGGDGGHLYGDRFTDMTRNRSTDALAADARSLFGGKKKFHTLRTEKGYQLSEDAFYARLRRDAMKRRLSNG